MRVMVFGRAADGSEKSAPPTKEAFAAMDQFTEARELVAGFSIWEVKDMDEAVAWAKRSPNSASGRSEIEIRPFYEAADLAEFVTPEELAAPRDGERGKLGVA